MVRIAEVTDAQQLLSLNDDFNGKGGTTIESIRNSLLHNHQEVVIVDEEHGRLTGFVCVQLKRSFCYEVCHAEIAEVYVAPDCRRRGIASRMIAFAEKYCGSNYPLHKFELLTGEENTEAQSVYLRLGYEKDGEIHLSKRI